MQRMQRWKLTIEYDGRPYCGWQRQANSPSVQQRLEEAIFGFSDEEVRLHVAGRTDTGVHALGQVAHFDIKREMTAYRMRAAINAFLHDTGISIIEAEPVPQDFHARFHAKYRSYRYHIINRKAPLTFKKGLALHVPQPLDAIAMQKGAKHLIGHHDFSSFRGAGCQAKSPLKSIDILEVSQKDDDEIIIYAKAPSFLYHQIRNIVGTLIYVGIDKYPPEWVKTALEAKNRCDAGPTAPPDGLYFVDVGY